MTQTSDEVADDAAIRAVWDQQSVWSQAANRAKATVDRARLSALILGVLAAVLGAAASQTLGARPAVGRVAALLAAIAAGAAPLVLRGGSPQAVNDWVRTRAVSEALKAEAYGFLSRLGGYRNGDAAAVLLERTNGYRTEAADLVPTTAGITPAEREVPAVSGPDSYVEQRLRRQLSTYYRPKAVSMHQRVRLIGRIELVLGGVGVILAAVAGVYEAESVAAWIAVAASVSVSVSAHSTSQRYAYQELEFARTAAELERLLLRWETTADRTEAFTDTFLAECEAVISIQNESWMIRWTRT
jgi:hypothetical protein